jgi:putative phage-type endonuclease
VKLPANYIQVEQHTAARESGGLRKDMSRYPENYLMIEQHTAAWYEARLGRVTASRVADAIDFLKSGKPSAKREAYKMELLQEILTGAPAEHFVSPAMDWGISTEPRARAAYEMLKEVDVERIGFVLHPGIARAGASPDGLIGADGLLEIKCPTSITHLSYITGKLDPIEQYGPQMAFQLACTERDYCDFVSFDPRLPDDFSLYIVRFNRDDKAIAEMEAKVEQFIAELNELCERLKIHADAQPKREPLPGPPRAEMPDVAGWVG